MDLELGDANFDEVGGNELNLAQEDMSTAFICGLVAQAGLQAQSPQRHDDGIDFLIGCSRATFDGVSRCHPRMYVQLKSTTRPELGQHALTFRKLKRERYDSLIDQSSSLPQALIVYVMPDDRLKWTSADGNHMNFNGHAFFLNMRDAPPLGPEDPVKVVLPYANRLTTTSLTAFYRDAITRHRTVV